MMLNLLRLWAVIALGLHLAGYILPEDTFWSLWPYTVLPPWPGVTLALVAGSLTVPTINVRVWDALRQVWHRLPGKTHPQRWFAALSMAALPIFWLLRIRHLGWGDANILVIGLSHPKQTVIYNWQAPFTVFLHQRLWALVADPLWGWGVDTVYAAVSVICGGLFVFGVLKLANALGRTIAEKTLIAGLVLTCGSMQLFFGYVENYTIISLGILIFLWTGINVLRGKSPLWQAVLALSLTNAFHPSTVVLWPAALYLAWKCARRDGLSAKLMLEFILPPLIVGNSVLTMMELGDHGLAAFLGDDRPGGGDHIWFVPITLAATTQWQRYTIFSLAHLLDWGNEQFLTSVFGLVILAIGGITARRKSVRAGLNSAPAPIPGNYLWFLGIASISYLLLTFAWNADYGIRKDWDLFSPATFVYSLWAALVLIRRLKDTAERAQAAILIIAVSGLHTAAWVLSNVFLTP